MIWAAGAVTVRVPATSANLGPGFDSFGLALSLHDVVTASVTASGLTVQVTGEGAGTAGAGEQHLVVRAMRTAFAYLGAQPPGLALACRNEIPQGFGLGSSAGAIVAGLLAARALAGPASRDALPDDLVLALATRLEGHPDNVAACLAGGLTIAWNPSAPAPAPPAPGPAPSAPGSAPPSASLPSAPERPGVSEGAGVSVGTAVAEGAATSAGPRVARLMPLPGIFPVLCVPSAPLATVTARQVLPPQVPHADAAANAARAALLVAALTGQPGLLLDATEDYLHQAYRASAMPGTARLITALRAAGIPAVVSGAGPSVLAFTAHDPAAASGPAAGTNVAALAAADADDWKVIPLHIDTTGAIVTTR